MAQARPLYQIAAEIRNDWKKPYFAAVPYIDAMRHVEKVTDLYFTESGREIVKRFLANAGTWRGDVAKRVKAELKAIVK